MPSFQLHPEVWLLVGAIVAMGVYAAMSETRKLANLVNRDDVGMLQTRGRLRFNLKTLDQRG